MIGNIQRNRAAAIVGSFRSASLNVAIFHVERVAGRTAPQLYFDI